MGHLGFDTRNQSDGVCACVFVILMSANMKSSQFVLIFMCLLSEAYKILCSVGFSICLLFQAYLVKVNRRTPTCPVCCCQSNSIHYFFWKKYIHMKIFLLIVFGRVYHGTKYFTKSQYNIVRTLQVFSHLCQLCEHQSHIITHSTFD